MIVVTLLLGLLACALLLPTVSDCLSIFAIATGGRSKGPASTSKAPPHLLILIPAHNEELMVAACVESVRRMRYPAERYDVVVVADNCDDHTARRAWYAGARCLERADRLHPGKPRAIAWALEQCSLDGYDALVILDADTVVDPEFAMGLAGAAPLNAKAVQAYYDVENRTETALTRLATLLAAANHRFAYPLKRRAGLNTPLVGNGMCIGTDVVRAHGWKAFSIAEDWEMYAQLTERGVSIEGAPDAVVYSQEAHTLQESLSQRERWTAGKLTVFARSAWPLLRSRHVGPRQKLDAIAELSAPGPVLHLGLATLGSGAAWLLRLPPDVVVLLATSLVRPLIYAAFALRVQPDRGEVIRAFAFVPIYALWRIGAAVSAIRMVGDKPWIRTQRHPRVPGDA